MLMVDGIFFMTMGFLSTISFPHRKSQTHRTNLIVTAEEKTNACFEETVKPQIHLQSRSIGDGQHTKQTVHWNDRDGNQTTLQKPWKIFS